jgi:hypothetical protein
LATLGEEQWGFVRGGTVQNLSYFLVCVRDEIEERFCTTALRFRQKVYIQTELINFVLTQQPPPPSGTWPPHSRFV